MQGGAGVSKDVLPYTIAHRVNIICGLNVVGLRRAGLKPGERLELKRLYRFLFREGRTLRLAITEARKSFTSEPSRVMLDFADASKRGLCAESGKEDTWESTSAHEAGQ